MKHPVRDYKYIFAIKSYEYITYSCVLSGSILSPLMLGAAVCIFMNLRFLHNNGQYDAYIFKEPFEYQKGSSYEPWTSLGRYYHQ